MNTITKEFTFDTAIDYTYDGDEIIVALSKAELEIIDKPDNSFPVDFSSNTGFTYDSTKSEFSGGQNQQVDQRPTDAIFYASYSTDENANWSNDDGTGTLNNGAVINANGLDVSAGATASCSYTGNIPKESGCIRLRNVIFNDTSTGYVISTGLNDELYILRTSATALRIIIKNNAGGSAVDFTASGLTLTPGTPYELELNWNQSGVGSGEAYFYIDGVKKGQDLTWNGDRTGSSDTQLFVGSYVGSAAGFNGSIGSVLIFDTLQHSGVSYTPDWSDIFNTIYKKTYIQTPELEDANPGTIVSFDELSYAVGGTGVKLSIQIGRSGNYLKYNGSTWVAMTDATDYDEATTIATFEANVESLPVEGEIYGQYRIYYPDSNTQHSISELISTLTIQEYSRNNPTIKNTTVLKSQGIDSIEYTETNYALDYVRHAIEVNGVNKYWNGSSWAISSGFSETSEASDVEDNISSLNISSGADIRFVGFLHSNNGVQTPILSNVEITYDVWGGGVSNPKLCLVYGYIRDITNEPPENVTIEIQPKNNANYNNEIQVTTHLKEISPDSTGYWEILLFKSSELSPVTQYLFNFQGERFSLVGTKTIPDEISINYLNLE